MPVEAPAFDETKPFEDVPAFDESKPFEEIPAYDHSKPSEPVAHPTDSEIESEIARFRQVNSPEEKAQFAQRIAELRGETPELKAAATRSRLTKDAAEAANNPSAELLRPPTLKERIGMGPIGAITGIGRGYERELQQKVGAGPNVLPQDIVGKAFEFSTPPPPVREAVTKATDIALEADPVLRALPESVKGTAQGARDIALQVPFAAGAVGMGKNVGRALLGIFTGEYVWALPEQKAEFDKAMEAGDTRTAARVATSAIAGGALLGAGISHEASALPSKVSGFARKAVEKAEQLGLKKSVQAAEQTKGVENAVQIEKSDAGVLREERPEVELQGVEPGNAPQEAAGEVAPAIPAETPPGEAPVISGAAVEPAGAPQAKTTPAEAAAPVSEIIGMGGARPEEFGPSGTGLKNATAELERIGHGLEDAPPSEKQAMAASWERAKASDPIIAEELADAIIADPRRSLTGDESALLLRHKRDLLNAKNDAAERTFTAETPEAKAEAEAAFQKHSERLTQFLDAMKSRGSHAGRELRWRQALAFEDYSFESMSRERAQALGRELTTEEHAAVKAQSERISELEKKIADAERQAAEADSLRAANEELQRTLKEAKENAPSPYILKLAERIGTDLKTAADAARARIAASPISFGSGSGLEYLPNIRDYAIIGAEHLYSSGLDFAKWSTKMVGEFSDKITPHLETIFKESQKVADGIAGKGVPKEFKETVKRTLSKQSEKPAIIEGLTEAAADGFVEGELSKYVKSLAKIYVEQGVNTLDGVVKAVRADLEPIFGEMTDRQVRDAFSDYGKSSPATTDAVKVRLSQLRGEAQKTSALSDVVEKNQAPLATGPRRVPPAEETRRLTKKIHEEMKKRGIQVTDPVRQLATSLQTIKTRLDNAIADIRFELSTRSRIVREKGVTPSDAEVVAKRAELAELRRQRDEMFPKEPMSIEARLKIAERNAEKNEAMWNDRLERARKGDFGGEPVKPALRNAKIDAIKARAQAAAAEVDHLKATNEAFQEAKRVKEQTAQIAEVDKRIEEVTRQINEGDVAAKSTPEKPVIPELAAKRAELAELNKIKQQLRNAAKPKLTPEEITLKAAHTRTLNSIADLQDRIARGDFLSPRKKPLRLVPDDKLNTLRAENERWKQQYLKGNYEARMAARSNWQKVKDGIRQAWRLPKNLVASFDFSAPRQAAGALLAAVPSPTRWKATANAFREMFKGWASETTARRIEQEIRNRPNAKNGLDTAAKIEYTSLDEHSFTKAEENARSILDDWAALDFRTGNTAKTIVTAPVKAIARGVRMSNRAFITFLNKTRSDLFDTLLASEFPESAPTQVQLEKIGNLVNVMTGRGKLNPVTQTVAGSFLWSPKLLTSRLQTLLGQPFVKAGLDAKVQKIVAKEYLRMLIGGYALWNVAQLFGDKHEKDPRSSDFGKAVMGNTRVDPWGGYQQVTTLGARMGTGETKTIKGKVVPISGKVPFGGQTKEDVALRFLRTKLNPEAGLVYDITLGNKRNPVGEPVTVGSAAKSLTVPLTYQDIFAIAKEHGIPKTVVLEALSAFGAGVSQYEKEKTR